MGQLVSIHSYRGGTGKSNLVASLAFLAARRGKRVAVLDSDLQAPGVHVLFGFNPNGMPNTFSDFVAGKCDLSEAAYRVDADGAPNGSGNLFLIPSRLTLDAIMPLLADGYDAGRVNDQLSTLINKLQLDLLLLDSHPGFNEETLLTAAICDTLVIVLRPDQQDYHGTAVLVEMAARLHVPNIRFLVNKVMSGLEPEDVGAKVEQAYGKPVIGVLPFRAEMATLGSKGVFASKFPRDPLTAAIDQVVTALLEQEPTDRPPPKGAA
ncbi:MAG: MinD/ParA family protein [Phycisphaerales bacterium]|nr:MinD/ParA family protein [Phycisphaerales bacterium]MCI0629178.1 MinD/ParA family protein [Phycisphaerales bacterium]MCI0675718.1 MinD/ParA family protein [Phycisphaerales bacterium]